MAGKMTVLVADAAELTRAVVSEIFAPEFSVAEVGEEKTLMEAMRHASSGYAALLLGALPTEKQSIELLEQINAEGLLKDLPVFLMLQSNSDADVARGMAAGALDVVEKPLNPVVVRRRVSNGIELYSCRTRSDLLHQVSTLLNGSGRVSFADTEPPHLNDRTLRLLELERRKYQMLSEMSSDITFTYDCARQEAIFSERYREIFGGEICQQGSFGTIVAGHLLPEDIGVLRGQMVGAISREKPLFKTEIRLRTADGSTEWFELYIRGFFDPDAPNVCLTCLGKLTSIGELKQEASRWQKRARTDSLTGLYNRQTVQDLAEPLLGATAMGILFIDIDDFKAMNDSHGHLFGDWVLRQVARAISESLRSTDIVGRVGGDEFVAVLKELPSREILRDKAAALGQRLRQMKLPDGRPYPVTCSVGLAVCPDDGVEYEQLLEKADRALYYVKNHGKDGWAFYDPALMPPSAVPTALLALSEVDNPEN